MLEGDLIDAVFGVTGATVTITPTAGSIRIPGTDQEEDEGGSAAWAIFQYEFWTPLETSQSALIEFSSSEGIASLVAATGAASGRARVQHDTGIGTGTATPAEGSASGRATAEGSSDQIATTKPARASAFVALSRQSLDTGIVQREDRFPLVESDRRMANVMPEFRHIPIQAAA